MASPKGGGGGGGGGRTAARPAGAAAPQTRTQGGLLARLGGLFRRGR